MDDALGARADDVTGPEDWRAREQEANAKLGWTPLPDGSYAKVAPDGKIISTYVQVTGWESADGEFVYDTSEEERERRDAEHRRHVEEFKRGLARERSTATRRQACLVARKSRPRGAGRPRARAIARASSRGGDSGDDGSGSEPPGERTGPPLLLLVDPPGVALVSAWPPSFGGSRDRVEDQGADPPRRTRAA